MALADSVAAIRVARRASAAKNHAAIVAPPLPVVVGAWAQRLADRSIAAVVVRGNSAAVDRIAIHPAASAAALVVDWFAEPFARSVASADFPRGAKPLVAALAGSPNRGLIAIWGPCLAADSVNQFPAAAPSHVPDPRRVLAPSIVEPAMWIHCPRDPKIAAVADRAAVRAWRAVNPVDFHLSGLVQCFGLATAAGRFDCRRARYPV